MSSTTLGPVKVKPGQRELVYFLSRFPLACNLGDWRYDPYADMWKNPVTKRAMRIEMEASQSIATCLHNSLTREEIDCFVRRHLTESAP